MQIFIKVFEKVKTQVEKDGKTIKEKVKNAIKKIAVKVKKSLHASYQTVRVIGDSMSGVYFFPSG